MVMIELLDDEVVMLIKCKKAKERGFYDWTLRSLLREAVFEFYKKYGDDDGKEMS